MNRPKHTFLPAQRLRQLLLSLVCLLPLVPVQAEVGVSAEEIRLGMVNAQSGPAAGLGIGMRMGAQAFFDKVNAAGGVHGRRLSLSVRDDGYEPARSMAQTHGLIDSGNVFALFGYVGTPTSRAVMPMVMDAQVPYLFPFSGALVLREPVHPWVFNVRASYLDETRAMAELMAAELGIRKVALLMQDDSFGETVKGGLVGALAQHDLKITAEARVTRNSLTVAPAIEALRGAQPEAVFFVGTYLQLVEAVKQAKAAGMQARFFTVSFVGTDDFIERAGTDGNGVYISQVLPSPYDDSLDLVRRYRKDLQGARPGYASLEGYVGAEVLVRALRSAGEQPTRSSLIKALDGFHEDLGGFDVAFSPRSHQGSTRVYLTRVQDGRALPVE